MWEDKRVLITAGPTQEAIDPVRYISNQSSGKMGLAIAEHFAKLGAKVELILGPTNLSTNHPNITTHPVKSAQDMFEATDSLFNQMDVGIFAAAVADYTPKVVADNKIKKQGDELTIELVKTKDILKEMGAKKQNQFLVGFALETNNEINHAKEKLEKKNLDLIVLNSLKDDNAGFQHDTNKITIIDKSLNQTSFPLKSKTEVAIDIINKIEDCLN